jgi:hypothetical protein
MTERPLWLAIAFCMVVRAVLQLGYGLVFDLDLWLWQLLDPALLRDDALRSLYLMHAQPPLFNALLAVALKLPDGMGGPFLPMVLQAASLVSVALVYLLLRRARLGPAGAAIAAGLFGVLPQVLIYESAFNYAPFEVMFLLAGTLLAARYLEEGSVGRFAGLCACLIVLALTRSLFHIGWIAVVLLAVWGLRAWRHPGQGWTALAVLVASLAVVSSVYFKNLKLYGIFAASSWEGIALTQMAAPWMESDRAKFPQAYADLHARIDRGEFSPALKAGLSQFIWYGWMERAKDCGQMEEARPVLCAKRRSNGEPNLNHLAVVDYSRELSRDARRLLLLYPQSYLNHVAASAMTFLGTPSWDYRQFDSFLPRYTAFWNELVLYRPGRVLAGKQEAGNWWGSLVNRLAGSSVPLMMLVITSMVLVLWRGASGAWGYWRGRDERADWVFPAFAVLLYATIPHLTNGVEAQRIRYSIEPLLYVALITAGVGLLRRR